MWTSSNWSVPGALRRACDPQLAPSRRGDRSLGATWVRTCAGANTHVCVARRQGAPLAANFASHAFSWRGGRAAQARIDGIKTRHIRRTFAANSHLLRDGRI